jgi:SAM-dependent methyltransferase
MGSFDRYADEYDSTLNAGLKVTGEDKRYFLEGRVRRTAEHLRRLSFSAASVLDYGCGTGESAALLGQMLSSTRVVGVDTSFGSLEVARKAHASPRVQFSAADDLPSLDPFDLVYVNGVFHHVPPAERSQVMQSIATSLRVGGILAFWENNPYNPGTRWVMSRLPFDADAVMLSPSEARRLARHAQLQVLLTEYCFFFPRLLERLRGLEPSLRRVPLGGQYLMVASKASSSD